MKLMRTIKVVAGLVLALSIGVWSPGAHATTLAQFSFDALTSGNTVAPDISGNNHDATFGSVVTQAPGVSGAPGDYSVVLPSSPPIGFMANPGTINLNNGGSNEFTLEVAFKLTAYGTSANILRLDNSDNGSHFGLAVFPDGRVEAFFNSYSHGWVTIDSTTPLPLNTWSRLALVYNLNADAYLYLYVNGVQIGDRAYGGIDVPGSYTSAFFGQQPGLIDDVRISDAALTPDEFLGVPEPSTLSLWVVGVLALRAWRRRR